MQEYGLARKAHVVNAVIEVIISFSNSKNQGMCLIPSCLARKIINLKL